MIGSMCQILDATRITAASVGVPHSGPPCVPPTVQGRDGEAAEAEDKCRKAGRRVRGGFRMTCSQDIGLQHGYGHCTVPRTWTRRSPNSSYAETSSATSPPRKTISSVASV